MEPALSRYVVAVAAGLVANILASPASAIQHYTATRLYADGGGDARAVSGNGNVTGEIHLPIQAFLYSRAASNAVQLGVGGDGNAVVGGRIGLAATNEVMSNRRVTSAPRPRFVAGTATTS